jgi:hypothetical protein
MTREPRLPCQHHVFLEYRAARQADLRHDDTALTNPHIVGDLNEIVDLGACPDDRIADTPTIDCRVRSYLYVIFDDAPTHVFQRHMTVWRSCEGKPNSTNPRARAYCYSVAQLSTQTDNRMFSHNALVA